MPRVAGQGEPQRVTETRESHRDANSELRATLMARLVAVSDTLRGSPSPDAAARAVGRALLTLTGAPRGAVFLRSQNGIVTCPWSHNLSDEYVGRLQTPEGANAWAHLSHHPELACMDLPARSRLRAAAPSIIEDIRSLPAGNDTRRSAEREEIRALCSWPLSRGGRVFAAVAYYFDTPHACAAPEREVVLAFALQATATLDRALAAASRGEGAAEADPGAGGAAEAEAELAVEAARLAALQRALDAEGARLSAERMDLAVERERLGGARRELDADRERLAETRRALETESERFASTRGELEGDRKRIADLRRASEAEQAELETFRRELDLERYQINGLRAEMDTARAELAKAQADLEAERAGVAKDRADLETERESLAEARLTLEAGRAEMDTARAELAKARAVLEAERESVAEARRTVEGDQTRVDQAERALAERRLAAEADRARAEQEARAAQRDRSGVGTPRPAEDDVAQRARMSAELEEEKSRLIEAHAQLTAAEADIAKTRAALEAETARLEAARRELEADRARLTEMQRAMEGDRAQFTELQAAHRTLAAECARLSGAVAALTDLVKAVPGDLPPAGGREAAGHHEIAAPDGATMTSRPAPPTAPAPAAKTPPSAAKTMRPAAPPLPAPPPIKPAPHGGDHRPAPPITSVYGRQKAPAKYSERLAEWAAEAARALGCRDSEVQAVRQAALLHGIDTPDGGNAAPSVKAILTHRTERWDGEGAPDHLKEGAIPRGARILAVAVAYADMVAGGPGTPMLYELDAKAQLKRDAGTAFDPEVVQAFCRVVRG